MALNSSSTAADGEASLLLNIDGDGGTGLKQCINGDNQEDRHGEILMSILVVDSDLSKFSTDLLHILNSTGSKVNS